MQERPSVWCQNFGEAKLSLPTFSFSAENENPDKNLCPLAKGWDRKEVLLTIYTPRRRTRPLFVLEDADLCKRKELVGLVPAHSFQQLKSQCQVRGDLFFFILVCPSTQSRIIFGSKETLSFSPKKSTQEPLLVPYMALVNDKVWC